MKRKISLVVIPIVAIALVWYLFIKPNDYLVSFTANTFPGAINQTIKNWDKRMGVNTSIKQKNLLELEQELKFGDSLIHYNWTIIPITDSTSKVKVSIKDVSHSLMNKIMIPFTSTVLEKRSKKNLINFNHLLNDHINKFKVKVVGEDELKPTHCAYLTIEGLQSEKAFGMIREFPFLSGFVKQHNLKVNGTPFVEIKKWNRTNDSIVYDFCYPIVKTGSLPFHTEIKYKEFGGMKALKAIYNGNYMTSDRAWYKLMDYAGKHNIELENKPVELFYDNPSMGGNELEWKAEIFMPLKNTNE